jgi:hypothetical protein
MQIQLAFRRMFLAPGKTFAVPAVAGARVRVVDGMVWATTSGIPDDIWLGAGEEHTIRRPGLTVIESLARSTVELIPPAPTGFRGGITNRYEMPTPKAAFNIAAIAMTAITIGLLVVLPAKLENQAPSRAQAAPSVVATTPGHRDIRQSRVAAPGPNIVQASDSTTSVTRVQ